MTMARDYARAWAATPHGQAWLRYFAASAHTEEQRRAAAELMEEGMREAGWVEQIVVGDKGEGMPFRTGGPATAWAVTEAGQAAIDACPDTFPGDPVYGSKSNG